MFNPNNASILANLESIEVQYTNERYWDPDKVCANWKPDTAKKKRSIQKLKGDNIRLEP